MAGLAGVQVQPHGFGGTEWVFGKREVGHVHGERLVDVPFTWTVRDEVIAADQAKPHHILPESGWVHLRNAECPAIRPMRVREYVAEHLCR